MFDKGVIIITLIISSFAIKKPCDPSIRNAACIDLSKECPNGWHFINGRCLMIMEAKVNFQDAVFQCSVMNGILCSFGEDNDVWLLLNKQNYKKNVVYKQKAIYIGSRLSDDAQSYVNLDDSPSDWLNVTGNSSLQCATIRPKLEQDATYVIEQEATSCDNKVDGFVCQLVRDEARHILNSCADKFDQDPLTMSCVRHAKAFWEAKNNGCARKDCCIYQELANCYLDNVERVCDEREHLVYMWKEHFNRNAIQKFVCDQCYTNGSECGLTSLWPEGNSPPLWVRKGNKYGITGHTIWYKLGQFPLQSALPFANC